MERAMAETGRRGLAATRADAARARISAGERAARGSLASRITEAVEEAVAQLLGQLDERQESVSVRANLDVDDM